MRMAEDGSYELRPGSVYTVRYGKEDDSVTGTFRGYTMIGSETAVVIDSGGKSFYIPAAAIECMALVKQAPDEKQHAANDIYYG
ncbi:MAG: hypothetical protein PWR17_406 [Candidatus Methanomethylophilaceae archaeon]|nr:hypothetical protein [Candidatus Methanomethylophilaceae archaeon]